MTLEMFIGGLIVLLMAVAVVVAMTSPRGLTDSLPDWLRTGKDGGRGSGRGD